MERTLKIYITFTVRIENEVTRIIKNKEEVVKHISYILQDFDSTRFMASSLSNLLIIFLKEFIKLNVNTDTTIKNVNFAELNTSIGTVSFNTQTLKMI